LADEIAAAFGAGLFDKPLAIHGELPPGAAAMTERKQRITYRYVEHPNGAGVVIETADPETREAIHAFLRYQILERKNGRSSDRAIGRRDPFPPVPSPLHPSVRST